MDRTSCRWHPGMVDICKKISDVAFLTIIQAGAHFTPEMTCTTLAASTGNCRTHQNHLRLLAYFHANSSYKAGLVFVKMTLRLVLTSEPYVTYYPKHSANHMFSRQVPKMNNPRCKEYGYSSVLKYLLLSLAKLAIQDMRAPELLSEPSALSPLTF